MADARAGALSELVNRLNRAIADPRYQVTGENLLDDGHSYTCEFDTEFGHKDKELNCHD